MTDTKTEERRPRNAAMAAAMARTGHTFNSLASTTGLNPSHLSRIAGRHARPNLQTATEIAQALGCTIEELDFMAD